MSDEKIDVLAVMGRTARMHWNRSENADAEDMEAARSAVAERIAADKALDALLEMPAQKEPFPEFNAQVAAARARRGIALLRVTVP